MLLSILLAPLALFFAATVHAQANMTLQEVLNSTEELSGLAALLESAPPRILELFNSSTDITILAPSNSAIELLEEQIGDDEDLLEATLAYHVLDGNIDEEELIRDHPGAKIYPTLLTDEEYVNVTGGQVVFAEIWTSGTNDSNVTFYSGYNTASQVEHFDVAFEHGVIHIIDTPLVIPPSVEEAALAAGLTALVGAVSEASFDWTSWSNNTFFAPTNIAFQSVAGALSDLSEEELRTILMYHVINDTVPIYTSDIDHEDWITTTGTNVTITVGDDGEIFVNSAMIVNANILVANGVLHVIDNVLNPNATDDGESGQLEAPTNQTMGLPAFTGAETVTATDDAETTNVPFTSGVSEATTTMNSEPTRTPYHSNMAPETASQTTEGSLLETGSTAGQENLAPSVKPGALGAFIIPFGAIFAVQLCASLMSR